MKLRNTFCGLICLSLAACGTTPISPSDKHIAKPETAAQDDAAIPELAKRTIPLPPPRPTLKTETYSVVVNNVSAQEILFALARDARINLDISSGIQGYVTVNAINQTLPQILDRISKQIDMRYELENGTLSVMPDKPFLKTYKIDFINMSRVAKSTNSTSSQISGTASGATATTGSSPTGNAASTTVTSETKNDLMDSLVKNVTDILLEEDRIRQKSLRETSVSARVSAQGDGAASTTIGLPGSGKGKTSGAEAPPSGSASGAGNETVQSSGGARTVTSEIEKAVSVFANKETGVLIVRATSKQHEKVQEFIDKVMSTAKRQVLIEATIVEVKLNDQYRQGINWTKLATDGFALSQAGTAGLAGTAGSLTIQYLEKATILSSLTFLEKFGNVKVLSSPKLSVMNNQTASLKVANSKVYFNIKADIIPSTVVGGQPTATYSTIANSVSVGLTMSVTPQISDNDIVTLNVRPSISSLIGLGVQDPNPVLANPCGFGVTNCAIAPIQNLIPEIQTREMESIIKIENGQTAVMGGLIQETIDKNSSEVPLLARIPLLGNLFQNRDDTTNKTELVIFLRPTVIKDASLTGDFKAFGKNLPDAEFFHEDARGKHTGN